MTRRAVAHDYTKTGIYHITLHVADGLWQPLGDVVGDAMAPDGMPDAPRVDMTPIGQMVEYELLHSIHEHYPMVIVDTYIIMPDHLHFILEVQDKIISRNGKLLPLGQVIAGFKKGCNKRYWEMTGNAGGVTACDTYGNRALLTERHCLPVVCHRKDAQRFAEQKQHCLEAAAEGAVLVSACISPREREIINESVNHGFPVITIHDNGFPDRYHPSAEQQELCAVGRLLLVSPWGYQYRGKNEQVTIPFCKAMNCVAQALCRTKDDWWKDIALK